MPDISLVTIICLASTNIVQMLLAWKAYERSAKVAATLEDLSRRRR